MLREAKSEQRAARPKVEGRDRVYDGVFEDVGSIIWDIVNVNLAGIHRHMSSCALEHDGHHTRDVPRARA